MLLRLDTSSQPQRQQTQVDTSWHLLTTAVIGELINYYKIYVPSFNYIINNFNYFYFQVFYTIDCICWVVIVIKFDKARGLDLWLSSLLQSYYDMELEIRSPF